MYLLIGRPHVEEANKLAPTFARIFKELIILTDQAKPLARAPKGTVVRKMVMAAYSDEVDRLYVSSVCYR